MAWCFFGHKLVSSLAQQSGPELILTAGLIIAAQPFHKDKHPSTTSARSGHWSDHYPNWPSLGSGPDISQLVLPMAWCCYKLIIRLLGPVSRLKWVGCATGSGARDGSPTPSLPVGPADNHPGLHTCWWSHCPSELISQTALKVLEVPSVPVTFSSWCLLWCLIYAVRNERSTLLPA